MRTVAVCGVLVLASACAREGGQPDTSASSVRATPSAATVAVSPTRPPAEQAAANAAIAAYLGLERTYDHAALTADYGDPGFERYSGDPVRHELQVYLFDMARSGMVNVVRGAEPTYSPVVASVDLAKDPPEVVIHDCSDSRSVYTVYKRTGKSAEPTGAPYQPHRKHPETATVRRYGGRWLVVELGGSRVQTC
jgi:hypothetical protein